MPKKKKTRIPALPATAGKKSPNWEEISEDLIPEFVKEAEKNKRISKELKQKKGKLKQRTITQVAFNFMKRKQKEGRLDKTAWRKGGVSLNTHGLIAAAKAGRLDKLVDKAFDGKGSVRLYQFIELRQKGIIPRKYKAEDAYKAVKDGNIAKDTAQKIAQGLGYRHYIHPYTTKGGRHKMGHFRNKIKPQSL